MKQPYLCTLTGADDTIDPDDLIRISEAYPFVEWGILIGSREGHRFPSTGWIKDLLARKAKINLSLHICGPHLLKITQGHPPGTMFERGAFQRCQLNFHAEPQGDVAEQIADAFTAMLPQWSPKIIFQLDGKNHGLASRSLGRGLACAGLHDLSHGAGILPDGWPAGGSKIFHVGYAGGLGPENVAEQLPVIDAAADPTPYWIDMETKLFTGLQFDLVKCQFVLARVEEFRNDEHPLS